MRRLTGLLIVGALVGVAGRVGGQAPAPDATTYTPPAQTTTVKGTAPALEGRWLLVSRLAIGSGPGRAVASLWTFSEKDGKLTLDERLVVFPPAVAQAMEKANASGGGTWEPTPAEIDLIRSQWDTMGPEGRGIASVASEIFSPDGYDDDIKKEPKTKDALWIVRQLYEFSPGAGRPIKQVNVVAALKKDGEVYTGNTTTVVVAAAPFPIPIKFEGTVRLIPIGGQGGGSGGGFLARVLDFFKGCNAK